VCGDDGRVALQAQDRRGLADVVGAADEHEVHAVVGDLGIAAHRAGVRVEHVERRGGRRRDEARHAERQQPGVRRVQRLDVLQHRERVEDPRLRQVGRQRAQDEDPVDVGVRVELGDLADDLAERGVARHLLGTGDEPQLVRVLVDPALVDLRREVVADEQRGDARRAPELLQLGAQRVLQLGADRAAVDQHALSPLSP
jgi:hypothetical protein